MIKYALLCCNSHNFEGWFQSSSAYDDQAARAQVTCPICGTAETQKAIMAPNVSTRTRAPSTSDRGAEPKERALTPTSPEAFPAEAVQRFWRKLREEAHANAEYVGPRFAEEARKIHHEEAPERGIYGEASADEVRSLTEEGVPFLPLPRLPEDLN